MSYDPNEKKGYDFTGKLSEKFETVHRGSFASREFVVEKSVDISGKTITNYIKFQCTQDRTNIVDNISIGDEIKVHFNLRGNKWVKDGRTSFFTNLDAWRIEPILAGKAPQTQNDEYLEPLDTFTSTSDENIDDLPF
ncbi:MAG: DUF3127 domain-containing protein [Ginsengibacter sp.]